MKHSQEAGKKQASGVPHWKWQRRSALILIPLTLWVLSSLIRNINLPFEQAHAWLAQPYVAVLIGIFFVAAFYHAKLGLQVIIEDYISMPALQNLTLKISQSVCWLAMIASVLSVVQIILNN